MAVLNVASHLASQGFRVDEFEAREKKLDMTPGSPRYASINPDLIVSMRSERYMVEVKKSVDPVSLFVRDKSIAYTQAERYAKAVEQRAYTGVILGVDNPELREIYPQGILTPLRRGSPEVRSVCKVLNICKR